MRKLAFSIFIVIFLFSLPVSATESVDIKASLTLSSYSAELGTGNKGNINVTYSVHTSRIANYIGVENIKIYKSSGEYVATITGTTENGLISTGTNLCDGTYTKVLTPGVSYYAKVTVFAEIGSTRDSRTITTNTVKAP